MLEVDDQIDDQLDSAQSKASSTQKKKKALQASGMEKIIALADKVFLFNAVTNTNVLDMR